MTTLVALGLHDRTAPWKAIDTVRETWPIELGIIASLGAAYLAWPKSKQAFEEDLQGLNHERIVDRWLRTWREKAQPLVIELANEPRLDKRSGISTRLMKLEHVGDPIAISYYFRALVR